jgi:alpha,alpha-trehalase
VVLDSLVRDEDTDDDKRITIDDPHRLGTTRGDKRFWIPTGSGSPFEVSGTYYLSNLLQELKLGEESGSDTITLVTERIFEPVVDRISRSIRDLYWNGLTRRVDESALESILSDEKTLTVDGLRYVYVASTDSSAWKYFSEVEARHPEWRMRLVRLPSNITPAYVRSLDGHHGLLTLSLVLDPEGSPQGEPFVVPGGRFNEMYGWDSYFIVLGLLRDGRVDLARSMVNNHVYQILHFGKVLNANRTYYLTRSQPPFLTSMILAVYQHLPHDTSTRAWLRNALHAAVHEYREVWMSNDRLTATGLSRYFDPGHGAPPEVEPGHFDAVFRPYAKRHEMSVREFEASYRSEKISVPELDEYFVHDRSMRESGHDTSYRLEGRSANLVTADLNSLLYKFETDLARIIEKEFAGSVEFDDGTTEESSRWYERAEKRRELVNRYLWNPEAGMFFDYDVSLRNQTGYVSAVTFYPLWAMLASNQQAELLVRNALPQLEMSGGIVSSTEKSRGPIGPERPPRQWDYPNGWAPHQMLVWQGLINYGYESAARRLAYRWLYTIAVNAANYNGTVPEKFDVVLRTHQVFAEYGNVGTAFSYITREGFGWTNASYQVGVSLLSRDLKEALNKLVPPEWIFQMSAMDSLNKRKGVKR